MCCFWYKIPHADACKANLFNSIYEYVNKICAILFSYSLIQIINLTFIRYYRLHWNCIIENFPILIQLLHLSLLYYEIYSDASEPKWVNLYYILYGVISIRLGCLRLYFITTTAYKLTFFRYKKSNMFHIQLVIFKDQKVKGSPMTRD